MNKKEKYLFAVAIVVVFIVFLLVSTGLASNNPGTTDQDQEVQVVILAHDEELVNETVTVASDTNLLDLMQQNYDTVITDDGLIESIEGVDQNPEESLFWIFEVNEEMVNESAEDFIPQEDDIITWELISF
ncbi:MAG: DUF4430 domain-containing protein [Alkalibacterium sp.]|nr:DUF4430 domain-containing protein [Alkalibacterium sp.]